MAEPFDTVVPDTEEEKSRKRKLDDLGSDHVWELAQELLTQLEKLVGTRSEELLTTFLEGCIEVTKNFD